MEGESKREKWSRDIKWTFHADRYESLVEEGEEEDRREQKEERKFKKKAKYKKYRKNVRRALHYTWKCFLLGLQSFSAAYSTSLAPTANRMPEFQRPQTKG